MTPSPSTSSRLLDQMQQDGYAVIPDVLTASEVSALRAEVNSVLDEIGIDKAGGTVLPNAAAEAPTLSWIFAHRRIIEAVRAATGLTDLVFTMEADLHRNYLAAQWHKDTGEHVMERGYFGVDWLGRDDCHVVKVALYLQDHSQGGALTVRPGTTGVRAVDEGEPLALLVKPGDIVLFDVRLSHRGVLPTLFDKAVLGMARLRSPSAPDHMGARMRRRLIAWSGRPDRVAVYFAFGRPNENSDNFARRNLARQLAQLGRDCAPLPPGLVNAFADQDVSTVNLGL